ncbi:hypothetical protein [Microlunatus speluncae]|uniref:hypothetical protein n=1 Tax=Microlunatus speluncae TaxID=2594267 RepID=UPI00126618D7|nr:hypothetical protein [Microlunatus speluncae]
MPDENVTVSRQEIEDATNGAAHSNRQQKSFYLSAELVERLTAACYWAQRFAEARTADGGSASALDYVPDNASSLAEQGLWAEVLRIEKALNDSKPFPPAEGRLKSGPGQRGIERLNQPRGARRTVGGGS